MIERVVYVSRAADHIGPREVFDIVRIALNRNQRLGLTGALAFLDGCFVQVLEGEPHVVRDRLARIAADPRHEGLDVRLRERSNARAFAGEWMALRLPQEIDGDVLARFGYAPGLPAARFDGPTLLALVQALNGVTSDPARLADHHPAG